MAKYRILSDGTGIYKLQVRKWFIWTDIKNGHGRVETTLEHAYSLMNNCIESDERNRTKWKREVINFFTPPTKPKWTIVNIDKELMERSESNERCCKNLCTNNRLVDSMYCRDHQPYILRRRKQ